VTGGAREEPRTADVDDEPGASHAEEAGAFDVDRMREPPSGLVDDPARHAEQDRRICLRAEHFSTLHAIAVPRGRRPSHQTDACDRDAEREHIGEQMDGVGEQRKRVEREPARGLTGHQGCVRYERDPKRSLL